MYFLGIEHGTRGVRCALLDESSPLKSYESEPAFFFEIHRNPDGHESPFPSILEKLEKHAHLSEIISGVMTYSMGDAFTEITDIRNLHNRGIISMEGAGRITGLGSSVFDELLGSSLTMFAIPGLHKNTPSLHPAFRLLYSHCSAPDKVCAAYQASLFLKSRNQSGSNFILSDVGSNTVSIIIENDRIIGGIDAALGAPGLLQGPIDLRGIRGIDSGDVSANHVFSSSGVFSHGDPAIIRNDLDFTVKYSSLIQSVAMEINGLKIFLSEPEAIIFTGSAHSIEPEIFKSAMDEYLSGESIHYLDNRSGAIGCAAMARDIYHGKKEILGIPVSLN